MILLARLYFAIHDSMMWLAKWFHGLAPLGLRLYLAPVMIAAGLHKLQNRDEMVAWFGNAEWGLGLPEPELLVTLVTAAELGGGVLLLIGLAVRWAAIPLMVTMAVAAATVHFENGWFEVTPTNVDLSPARPLATLGIPQALDSLENSREVARRLERAKGILQANGNYEWLSERGDLAIKNNGVQFAVTYYLMLLLLFYTGGGALSLDYWINRRYRRLLAEALAAKNAALTGPDDSEGDEAEAGTGAEDAKAGTKDEEQADQADKEGTAAAVLAATTAATVMAPDGKEVSAAQAEPGAVEDSGDDLDMAAADAMTVEMLADEEKAEAGEDLVFDLSDDVDEKGEDDAEAIADSAVEQAAKTDAEDKGENGDDGGKKGGDDPPRRRRRLQGIRR